MTGMMEVRKQEGARRAACWSCFCCHHISHSPLRSNSVLKLSTAHLLVGLRTVRIVARSHGAAALPAWCNARGSTLSPKPASSPSKVPDAQVLARPPTQGHTISSLHWTCVLSHLSFSWTSLHEAVCGSVIKE